MIPEAGTVIDGRYALLGPLDRGAMGAVWLARDNETQRLIAVKVLLERAIDDDAVKRFRREANALEHLDHPHIVRLLDHGVYNRAPFIAMELLDGESLKRFSKRRELPALEVLELLRQAAAGLAAAHALGIVHRDVKPSNLFVCHEPGAARVKVIDFGIARGDLLELSTQSADSRCIGSPAYMSPEQVRGEHVDQRADLWSLSVVAFKLLTGYEPFAGANVPETLERICSGKAPRASGSGRALPAALDAFFERAFAASVGARFQNVDELLRDLCRVFGVAPNSAASPLTRATPPPSHTETFIWHEEPEHCIAWHENVQLMVSLGPPNPDLMRKTIDGLGALARQVGRGTGALVIIKSTARPPDAASRAVIRHELARSPMLAAAQVVEGTGFRGAAIRSALNLIQFALRPPYAIRTFSDVSAGSTWLCSELRTTSGYAPDPAQLTKAAHEVRSRLNVAVSLETAPEA